MSPFPTIQWMSSMRTYVLPPFCTTFSLPDFVYPNNHAGVRCRASDSHRKSNDIRYLVVHLTAQNTFQPQKQTNQQGISRSSSGSRPTLVTLGKVNIPNNGFRRSQRFGLSQKRPSSEVAITRHRPSGALAQSDSIFWYDQFTRTRDGWCAAATRRSRS